MPTRLRAMVARARDDAGDEGMAIAIVLMMILIITSLSVLTLGLVLSQVKPTVNAANRVQALQTAESGIQAMTSLIRTATTDTEPDMSKLPCDQITGAPSVQRTLSYQTTVTYYNADPSGLSKSQLAERSVPCKSKETAYALITAQAVQSGGGVVPIGSADRNLQQVYAIAATNGKYTAGGQIHAATDPSFCIAAQGVAGAEIEIVSCSGSAPSDMSWAYRKDFRVLQTSSTAGGATPGLCWTITSFVVGAPISLQECGTGTLQQWGYEDAYNFSIVENGVKLCVATPKLPVEANDKPTLKGCTEDPTSSIGWVLDTSVGSGGSLNTDDNIANLPIQWVNYADFGRCMDFTDWGERAGSEINEYQSYTCKNDPSAGVAWTQILTYDDVKHQLWTYYGKNGQSYDDLLKENAASPGSVRKVCLTTQGDRAFDPNKRQAGLADCDDADSNQRWLVERRVPGSISRSYTVRRFDDDSQCLEAGPDLDYLNQGLKYLGILTNPCNGSNTQKWNAPQLFAAGGPKDLQENDSGR